MKLQRDKSFLGIGKYSHYHADYMDSIQYRIDKFKSVQQPLEKIRDNAKFFKKMKEMGIGRHTKMETAILGPTDEAVKYMFKIANNKLEEINQRTSEKFQEYNDEIDKLRNTLKEGEQHTFELYYTNVKGEHVHDNFGVEMHNGELRYYHMDDSNPEVAPQPSYDTPHNILYGKNGDGILAKALRSQAKSELGIGEEIYQLKDTEGNLIVITDPREELDKNGNVEKSFEKGYNNFNVYRITPAGEKELLHKDDITSLFYHGGIDQEAIRNRQARKGNLGGQIRTVLMVKREIDRAVQEGMDMTTSTRS